MSVIQYISYVRWTRRDFFIHINYTYKTEKNSLLFHFREWNFINEIISNYNHSHQFREWNYIYKNVTSGPLYVWDQLKSTHWNVSWSSPINLILLMRFKSELDNGFWTKNEAIKWKCDFALSFYVIIVTVV